ncbi:hypothetical protein GFS24_09485 [Chitinophaga sp. SYP-B3965]|uniref:hypothetical protein n=1 Tax=Chitinophaga sp. SYP-B3965 TaxID=2663120 RepID=UPI001299A06B|nr:hypothetical protein [Chitinophaga sp. SYP-B3965]MRG45348.1 hypothetical protein [Chitinophaga sp. SYP-B3965]
MTKQKAVFLFGAGATFPWGSPSTKELTDLILDSGFYTRGKEKKRITKFIYETLLDCGYTSDQVNFETIINIIEELITYYGSFNYLDSGRTEKLPSLISCFTIPHFEAELLNFSTSDKGKAEHGYKLEIPEGDPYEDTHYSLQSETPAQFFYQHLLIILLSAISDRISKYAWHTSGHSSIKTDDECSVLFTEWMQSLYSKNVLRLYTLNYEKIFKVLLSRIGIEVFDGFNCSEYIDLNERLRANVPRILSDDISNIHYNLHGSIDWRVLDLDRRQLPNAELILTAYPHLPMNDTPATF